jgi:phosphopentomutase
MNRAIVLVCDSLGVGELPDAGDFGDEGSNTLGHVLDTQHPKLPTLTRLGLLHTLPQPASKETPQSAFGRMAELSAGKDTTTGHWEMMGLIVKDPFRTYPNGFPDDVIREYERRIGRKTLGNKPASGTVILDELGEEHMRTGYPIVYTSADSVFQVAAHEQVIPVEELWRICAIARELMRGANNVGRIIARPFVGSGKGHFKRTANRRDFSVRPTGETVLDDLLFITADHGCDPTDLSTDHTREYVPLLIAGPQIVQRRPLGTRSTFADLGATICDHLGIPQDGLPGTSALPELR